MAEINVSILGTGTGTCSLTGKEGSDGLTVRFEDGTLEGFLSWKAFKQLLSMKAAKQVKGAAFPVAQPANGEE
jgi:hypothetical protein